MKHVKSHTCCSWIKYAVFVKQMSYRLFINLIHSILMNNICFYSAIFCFFCGDKLQSMNFNLFCQRLITHKNKRPFYGTILLFSTLFHFNWSYSYCFVLCNCFIVLQYLEIKPYNSHFNIFIVSSKSFVVFIFRICVKL